MWRYLIITGASKGLGQSLAIQFTQHFTNVDPCNLTIVLTGRDNDGLERSKSLLSNLRSNSEQLKTVINVLNFDLSDLNLLNENTQKLFISGQTYEEVILISNAGSLGPLQPIGCEDNLKEMTNNFNMNITSTCYITSEVIRNFKSQKLTLINISSLCAVQPVESWGLYCTGKAARDMFYRIIAEENKSKNGDKNSERIRVLNYAPGPLDTDMQKEIRESPTANEETKVFFNNMKEQGTLISPDLSAAKCVYLYKINNFENGAHLDYYDINIE